MILICLGPLVSPVDGRYLTSGHSIASTSWATTYQGILSYSITPTRDQGVAVSGYDGYGWIGKFDSFGNLQWAKDYRSTYKALSIFETKDGGFVSVGDAAFNGTYYGWILKLDSFGTVEWSRLIGRSTGQSLTAVQQTSDGGFIAAGTSNGLPGASDLSDAWLVRLDRSGSIAWQYAYGRTGFSNANSVQETVDHDFIVAGNTPVNNTMAAWVFKIDGEGQLVWQKAYAVTNDNHARMIRQTSDGGFIMDSDVTNTSVSPQSTDTLFLRLDRLGNVVWKRLYSSNGIGTVNPGSIYETVDGGFIAAGGAAKFFGVEGPFNGANGAWLVKLDSSGNLIWDQTYGKGVNDGFFYANPVARGGFIVGGNFESANGSVLLKTDEHGNAVSCQTNNTSLKITLASPPASTLTPLAERFSLLNEKSSPNQTFESHATPALVEYSCLSVIQRNISGIQHRNDETRPRLAGSHSPMRVRSWYQFRRMLYS